MTSISPINISEVEKHVGDPKKTVYFKQTDLEKREAAQELINRRREEEVLDLVQGNHPGISLKYLSYPVLVVLLVVATVYSGLSLMPQHDIMKEPEYWWVLAPPTDRGYFLDECQQFLHYPDMVRI